MASITSDLEFSFEQQNRRKGNIAAIIFVILCFLALFIPFTYPDPPPGQEGILVNLGIPDTGGEPSSGNEVAAVPTEEVNKPKESVPEKTEPKPTTKVEKPKPQPPVKKVVTSNTNEPSLAERKAAQKAEAERLAREKAAREAREKAAREAAAKKALEDERKRKAAEAKDFMSSLSSGSGSGTNPGNEGDPNGGESPITKGKSFGGGVVGGGLEDRGGEGPQIKTNFNKRGTVVIRLCVDASGNVTDAKYSQIGSSTADRDLINLALSNAKKWSFNSKSGIREQCGKITYQFTLK